MCNVNLLHGIMIRGERFRSGFFEEDFIKPRVRNNDPMNQLEEVENESDG